MPKKRDNNRNIDAGFTIYDCANAPKPFRRVKKAIPDATTACELAWDENQDDCDIVEEINSDGSKNFAFKKKRNHSKSEQDIIKDCPGRVYPEIVWYLISRYIKPEDVGNFAGINKATYAITKRESFWRTFYKRYCYNNPRLPDKLRLENSYNLYGLRQRVIRALFHTYKVFFNRVIAMACYDCKPHSLVKRRCVNVWYNKGLSNWSIYFKFKKLQPRPRIETFGVNILEELGRIDANPDDDTQVLQVICKDFYEVPPLMGMTLSSLSVVLSQGFRHHRLHLGFNTGVHVSPEILPECTVVLDNVINMSVFDWWHPKYPHYDNVLPSIDENVLPVLKKDFFDGEV